MGGRPLTLRAMRPGLLITIAILISIVAILMAVLLRFAFITPYCEVTVRKVERKGIQVFYELSFNSSANIETCNIVYRDGVASEDGGGGRHWVSNPFGAAVCNLRGNGGGLSSSFSLPRASDVMVPLVAGDVRRLGAGDELVLVEYRDADGVAMKRAILLYALGYDGKRLPAR